MHRALSLVSLAALLALGTGFRETLKPRAFYLAEEPIDFDRALHPLFTDHQLRGSAASTRAGLQRWASTETGRRLIAYFSTSEFRVSVIEKLDEDGAGRAPQPGIAMLVAAADHTKVKRYDLILNPDYGKSKGFDPMPGTPSTQSDMMAVAWAAEMLHIYYYSRGISLPHHERADFQEEWHAVAAELGFPALRHDGKEAADVVPSRRVIYW
jgi:hypothetical protein